MYDAAKRLEGYRDMEQTPVILHFGDHDPSGMDMTRDIRERLAMFAGDAIEVDRLALNMDQVRQYNPPPNPAKETDSRAAGYIEIYGHRSWELDALEPDTLAALVEDSIERFKDQTKWAAAVAEEKAERSTLWTISRKYDNISEYLTQEGFFEEIADETEEDEE